MAMKIELPYKKHKKIVLPMPRIMSDDEKYKMNKISILNEKCKPVMSWSGLQLEAKLITTPAKVAETLMVETGFDGPVNAVVEDYSWGKVRSFCSPSSGGTCAFLLQPKNDKISLVLRHSASVGIAFDFSKVVVLDQ